MTKAKTTITATGKVFLIDEDTSDAKQGDIRIVAPKEESLNLLPNNSKVKHGFTRAEICLLNGQAWAKVSITTFKGLQGWRSDDSCMTKEFMQLFAAFMATCKGSVVKFSEDGKTIYIQPNTEIGEYLDSISWEMRKMHEDLTKQVNKAA